MPARWPVVSSEGSITVAARYVVTRPAGREALEHFIEEWPESHPEMGTLCTSELSLPPHLVPGEQDRVDVVFKAKPGSRFWKDVMVGFVRDAPPEMIAEFEGFADLVGGKFRPYRRAQASGS